MNKGLTTLLSKLDIYCEPGREGALIKFLGKKLTQGSNAEFLTLIKDSLASKETEPSLSLLKEIRILKKPIDNGLRKRAIEITPEVDALFSYGKLKGSQDMKPIADYLLEVAVELGHPGAFLEMAKLHDAPAEREYWLLKAIHKGSAEATYRLAHFYLGFGNEERHQELIMKARDMGHAEACYEYIDGFMEKTDRSKPIFGDMLRDMEALANEQHHIKAMTKAAFHYGDSTCPYYDLDKAISLWKRSASPDNPESCYYLAVHYRQLGEEAEEAGNKEEATKNYNLAMEYADYGYQSHEPFCGRQLGFVLMNLERYDESYKVFKVLSDEGDGRSTRTLGLFYSKGLGRDEDWEKALPFFEKAVEQGYKSAEYDVGLSLEVLGRVNECVDHYILALESGYTFAAKHLADLLEEGTTLAKDEELSKQLCEYYETITGQDKPFWD